MKLPDEYEDPREIKTLRINRVQATQSRLASIKSPIERLKQTVFGQLYKEMRGWSNASLRRSFEGKGHGGQKRAFKVTFVGEGVNDYGGPYRAVFEQVADEAQMDSMGGGLIRKTSDQCLLPLLVPCTNRTGNGLKNQDKFVLSTAPPTPAMQDHMGFFGKLVGMAVRHNLTLALDLSALFWRPLVRLPVSLAHLETIDKHAATTIESVANVGAKWERLALDRGESIDPSFVPDEWLDLNFSVHLPDGSRKPLAAGGEEIPVNLGNWRLYVHLAENCRLRESNVMYKAFSDGLGQVLPLEIFPIFTSSEAEQLLSGTSKLDAKVLRQCTEYENLDHTSALVTNFWEVVDEMSDDERTLLLRFVWARSRMPASIENLPMNFKLQGQGGFPSDKVPLPSAQTCFFSLSLPPYESKETLRAKLIYAINNSPNMDADVRLHSAEGWADS